MLSGEIIMNKYLLSNFKNNKAFIHKDDATGYGPRICINTKGEKLFELPDKDMIVNGFEDEDVAFVMNDKGLYALMDNKGKFLTDFIYSRIFGGSEDGLFEVKRNGKHGHIDIQGREIIPCMYEDGCYFSEGVAAECLKGKWGMIDYFNKTVIPFEYDDINICKSSIIPVCKNGKWGLINKKNEILVDFLYDDIYSWGTRKCRSVTARKGSKYGFIDRYGNVIEDFIYDNIELACDSDDNIGEYLVISKENKKALYSAVNNNFLTDFIYDEIGYFSENRILANKNKKTGYLDIQGEEVIPFIYDIDSKNDFNEGITVLKKDGEYGAVDIFGNNVIPFGQYEKLGECREGLIYAADFDGQNGYIDNKGEVVIPFGKYQNSFIGFNEGFSISYDEKFGSVYINKKCEILKLKV